MASDTKWPQLAAQAGAYFVIAVVQFQLPVPLSSEQELHIDRCRHPYTLLFVRQAKNINASC